MYITYFIRKQIKNLKKPNIAFGSLLGLLSVGFFGVLSIPWHAGAVLSFGGMGLAHIILSKTKTAEGLSRSNFYLDVTDQLQFLLFVVVGLSLSLYSSAFAFPVALLACSFKLGYDYYQTIIVKHIQAKNESLLAECTEISDKGFIKFALGVISFIQINRMLRDGAQPMILLEAGEDGMELKAGYGTELSSDSRLALAATLVDEMHRRQGLVTNENFLKDVFSNVGKSFSENQNIRLQWHALVTARSFSNLPFRPFLSEIVNSCANAFNAINDALIVLAPPTISKNIIEMPYSVAFRVKKKEVKLTKLLSELEIRETKSEALENAKTLRTRNASLVEQYRTFSCGASESTRESIVIALQQESKALKQKLGV
jgi:hypothetical protein